MGLCCQKWWSKESSLCCKRIYTDIQNRLQRNLFTSCKIWNCSPSPLYCSARRLGYWSAWCQNSIPFWRIRWSNLYRTAWSFVKKGQEASLLLAKGHLWLTVVFKSSWNLTKLFAFLGYHVLSRVQDPECNLATYWYLLAAFFFTSPWCRHPKRRNLRRTQKLNTYSPCHWLYIPRSRKYFEVKLPRRKRRRWKRRNFCSLSSPRTIPNFCGVCSKSMARMTMRSPQRNITRLDTLYRR